MLILAYGPSSVTKGAVKRVRKLASNGGTVALVAAHHDAVDIANRLAGSVDRRFDGSGPDALRAALATLGSGTVIAVHDDVSVSGEELDAALLRTGDRPASLEADGSGACCVIGPADQLVDALIADSTVIAWDGRALGGVNASIRHDQRCIPAGSSTSREPIIVASMIVRNEAAMLADCLSSLTGVVDEVVVCDTGSTDETIEVARRYGAKVTESKWTGDFASARNRALGECLHADWVLWIDADERLVCDEPGRLRRELDQAANVDALIVSVRSTRAEGPETIGRAQRLFRPRRVRFAGAVHEHLARVDGEPVAMAECRGLTIDHLGYDESVVAVRNKASRNAAIAQAAHARSPNPKTALDLARSLAFAEAPAGEVLDAADGGLSAATADDPHRPALLIARAAALLDGGDHEAAYSAAKSALLAAPNSDVAAGLVARVGPDLGRDEEIVDLMVAYAREVVPPPLHVPANRVTALARGARAAVRIGDSATARALLAAGAHSMESVAEAWALALSAVGDLPAHTVRELLPAAESDSDAHAAAATIFDLDAATRPGEASAPGGGGPGLGGITFDFELSRMPAEAAAIADLIPGRRRILEWSGSSELTVLLEEDAVAVHSLPATGDLVAALERLGRESAQFDVVVGGVGPGRAGETLRLIGRLLDPSGRAFVWDLDGGGFARQQPGGVAAQPTPGGVTDGAALTAAAMSVEGPTPTGLVAVRPEWDSTLQIAELAPAGAVETLVICSPDPLADELQAAYRVSVPATMALKFVVGDAGDVASTQPILFVDPSVIPHPAWVQQVIDHVAEHEEPAGPRLIDPEGMCVQAGLDATGACIGYREMNDFPWLLSDRHAHLSVPYELPTPEAAPFGRVIGSAVAVTVASRQQPKPARIREVVGETVVVLGGPAPGREDPDTAASLQKFFSRALDSGRVPVYQWAWDSVPPDPTVLARWRRQGVVVVPPPTLDLPPSQFSPDGTRPRADALLNAVQPEAIVFLSERSLDRDYEAASNRAAHAPVVFAGDLSESRLLGRVDEVCAVSELADVVLTLGDRARCPRPSPVVPAIPAVEQRGGLVSIVIPVHNRWDLTAACLDRIAAHTSVPYEVIVVDNGSTDDTAAALGQTPPRRCRQCHESWVPRGGQPRCLSGVG